MWLNSRGRDDQQTLLIASELAAIREGVTNLRADVAVISQEARSIRNEQTRHEQWLGRIESEVQTFRPTVARVEDAERRIAKAEESVSDLKTWKTTEAAKWFGPKNILAALGALLPIAAFAWTLLKTLGGG